MKVEEIVHLLSQNKAEDIQVYQCDAYISQNVIIATSLNGVHSYALSERIFQFVKDFNDFCLTDGDAKDGWVAVEVPSLDLMVHLMIQEKRDYYKLEEIFEKQISKKKA